MAHSILCPIILVSLNVYKSKPFSCLPLTIIWPSPLECTHTHMPHTRRLLYNKAITIKAVRAGVLSITAEKLHLTRPAWHRVTCKHTRAQAICPNTQMTLGACDVDCICMCVCVSLTMPILATGRIISAMRQWWSPQSIPVSHNQTCTHTHTHTHTQTDTHILLQAFTHTRNMRWEMEAGGGPSWRP